MAICLDGPGHSCFIPVAPVYLLANIRTNITNIRRNDAYLYSKRGRFLSNKLFDRPGHGTGSVENSWKFSWKIHGKTDVTWRQKDTALEREVGSWEGGGCI